MNSEIEKKLRPWQFKSANELLKILRTYDSALDSSDTGTGKTYTALAIAKALRIPCLAIVPKIAISGWMEVAKHFDEKISIVNYEKLRLGQTQYGSWSNTASMRSGRRFTFVCCFCQRKFEESDLARDCFAHPDGFHCVERKARPIIRGFFQFRLGVRFIIFDEAHRCGGIKSLNSGLLFAAKRQRIKHLILSATPAQTVLQMNAMGYSLDLHTSPGQPNFMSWLHRAGVRRDPAFHGLVWRVSGDQQRSVMADIRDQIIPERGVRITTEQIPGFPEVDIQAQLVDIDDPEKIDKIYEEMESSLEALRERSESDKNSDSAITTILRSRQKIELLKIPAAIELAKDRLECGFSVGVFVNFRQSVEELSRRLECPFIDGTVKGEARNAIISAYQKNELRSLVLNSEAGGICIGLQDLDGNYPRYGIVFPPWSATVFKQLVGRFPRDGGKSKSHFRVLFAAGTIETKMHTALKNKLNNLDALTDGDLQPENLKL
jgi:hypothetical protein